jgi:hypothetical protein
MLYRGMDCSQLDAAYNNTFAVPERSAIYANWTARSKAARRKYTAHLDLPTVSDPASVSIYFSPTNPAGRLLCSSMVAIGR